MNDFELYREEDQEAIRNYRGDITKAPTGRSAYNDKDAFSWKETQSRSMRIKNRLRKFELSKERDQKIMTMFKAGYTISEMARETGLTRESVKSRIKRLKLK